MTRVDSRAAWARAAWAPAVCLLLGAVLCPSATSGDDGGATAVRPAGGELQVNTYTPGEQQHPSVGRDSDGDFVVIWQSGGSDGSDADGTSIQGQRYAGDGTAVNAQFQVNSYTTGLQERPAVAVEPGGDFVVVWHSDGSPEDDVDRSIQGQRFASDGSALGDQFQVNSGTAGSQQFPKVAVDTDGDFVVVRESDASGGTDSDGRSVQGRRFASDGTSLGSQFQVNTYTTHEQRSPAVAIDAAGAFVVAWESGDLFAPGPDGSYYGIRGQRFDADGTALSDELQVNTYTTDDQRFPAVAVDAEGDFVVVWESGSVFGDGPDGSYSGIQGQLYASDGAAVGDEFQVNSFTTGYQVYPALAMAADGGFVVTWESGDGAYPGPDGSYSSVQIQRFAADGCALEGEIQVNSYTTDDQRDAAVAVTADGDVVVTWSSRGSAGTDLSGDSVQAQRYRLLPGEIFTDGFESGDTSAW